MEPSDQKKLNHARQCSRRLALQALYQWSFTDCDVQELVDQYQSDEYWPKSDQEYFSRLVCGSITDVTRLDALIGKASDYDVTRIDPVELATLRVAVFELTNCMETPEKVIISEAIRLCRKFGSDEGYRLVNVILDTITKSVLRSMFT